ncbi:copia protein [Tanacetum coccineum]
MTSGQISLGLDLSYAPSTIKSQTNCSPVWISVEALYDDYIGGQPSPLIRNFLLLIRDVDELKPQQQHIQQQDDQAPLQHKTNINNVLNAMLQRVYVDDIIFGYTNPRYTQLFSDLMKSLFEMSMMGEMMFCLGLQVNQSPYGIFINHSNYVLEILKKYGMETCDSIGTPMDIKDKLNLDKNGTLVDAMKYRCKYTFKSTFGGLQFLGEKLVSGPPKKQGLYIAIQSWTQLTDYGFHFNKIPIYCDSKSAIAISYNPIQYSRTKHIVVRYHFIKEHIEKGTIELFFVKTDYQLANLFTKALLVDRFNYLVCHLGMRSLSPQELERLAKTQ